MDGSAFGGVDGGWAADARRENKPRRGFGCTLGVVDGVGVDMARVRAEAVSGDCVLGGVGLVEDLDLPLLLTFEPTPSVICAATKDTISSAPCVAVRQVRLVLRFLYCRSKHVSVATRIEVHQYVAASISFLFRVICHKLRPLLAVPQPCDQSSEFSAYCRLHV